MPGSGATAKDNSMAESSMVKILEQLRSASEVVEQKTKRGCYVRG